MAADRRAALAALTEAVAELERRAATYADYGGMFHASGMPSRAEHPEAVARLILQARNLLLESAEAQKVRA